MTDTLNKLNKITLGLACTLIMVAAGGAWSVSASQTKLTSTVETLIQTVQEVKLSLDRNTAQINSGDRSAAVLQTRFNDLERRVQKLEGK